MTNPSKKKGTVYETALLEFLRLIFGKQVERAPLKGTNDDGDFINVPVPIEAKNTKVLKLPEWARRLNLIAERHQPGKWALFWSGGDRRRKDCPGELMIVPARFGRDLLDAYYQNGEFLDATTP